MDCRIVFSDVDGTFLDSRHEPLPGTLLAVQKLREKGIPFIIISGRAPSALYPMMDKDHIVCPIVCFSGGMFIDEHRQTVFSDGMTRDESAAVTAFLSEKAPDCVWNIFCGEVWLTPFITHPRVIEEMNIVHSQALQGGIECVAEGGTVSKILCMCDEDRTEKIADLIREAFPALTVVPSSGMLLEVMKGGTSKGNAIRRICRMMDIPLETAAAFGDHFNDADMLGTVGLPFLMGNAPAGMKAQFHTVTDTNDNDGIYKALLSNGIID